jgi:hypothetical protein
MGGRALVVMASSEVHPIACGLQLQTLPGRRTHRWPAKLTRKVRRLMVINVEQAVAGD